MRLKIQLSYNNFKVPMSYQSIIQGVIYSLLSKDELGDFYHNDGYHYDKKHLNVLHLVNYLENIKLKTNI